LIDVVSVTSRLVSFLAKRYFRLTAWACVCRLSMCDFGAAYAQGSTLRQYFERLIA